MTLRLPTTRLGAALAICLLGPAGTAAAALPQQSASADLAAPGANPIVYGTGSGEQAGTSVTALGDVNGDGVDDLAVGAPLADANGRTDSGSVYVVYGRDGLGTRTDLARMSTAGVRIDGALAGDRLGSWIASAGDVDGDGRDDLIAGAPQADPSGRSNAGAAYVLTSVTQGSRIDLASLGAAGYRIDGAVAGDRFGSWVAGGGDVDGDGRDDVVAVAPQADPAGRSNAGSAWVVRGRTAGAALDLAGIGASEGFRIDGGAASDAMAAAAITPDATGDGRSDVLVGVPGADPGGRSAAGSAWLIDGTTAATVDLATPGAGARVDGALAGDALGGAVATSPDVTGDAIPELLLGATAADPNGRSAAGSLYLLPGRNLPAETDLASASPTARIDGAQANDVIGVAVSGGGDLNDDGRPDLAVGDSRFDAGRTDSGATYVLYGGTIAGTIDLAAPPAAATRLGGASSFEYSASSLAWLGDVNGDGRDDLLSGAPRADTGRTDGGAGYVLMGFGTPSFSYPATVEATAKVASDRALPTAVRRTGTATYTISPALPAGMTLDRNTGAISGMPATLIDPPTTHTLTLTDYAGTATAPVTVRVAPAAGACTNERPALTAAADVFTGSAGGDLIRAGAGADTVDGRAGDDCVHGEAGDDTLDGADGADKLYAGSEHDTVRAGAGDDTVTGEGGNDTIDAEGGNDTLSGGWDQDTIRGGEGDDTAGGDEARDLLFGDAGDDRLAGGADGDALEGGPGRDVVGGDAGDDRVDGGDDADEVQGGDGVDELYGGAGDDAVWANVENDFLDGGAGNDRLWAGPGRDSGHGGKGSDMLAGDEDDDDLFGDSGDDEMHGGAHQDELRGGEGNDVVLGDEGQDLVDGELGNDVLNGGAGFDNITGDAGADLLAGDVDNDILDGGAGDDALDGGPGDDRLFGAAGDDVVAGGDGRDLIEESSGRDRIQAGNGNDEVTLKRGGGATIDAGAGNDKVVAFNGKRDTVVCGAGRDTAYVDRSDKVKGCEKRVHSKPPAGNRKRRKSKK